jgi:hypothetical protein
MGWSSWLVDCCVAVVLERFGFLCFAILVVLPWEGLFVALRWLEGCCLLVVVLCLEALGRGDDAKGVLFDSL